MATFEWQSNHESRETNSDWREELDFPNQRSENIWFCGICEKKLDSKISSKKHRNTKAHIINWIKHQRQYLERNKQDVSITIGGPHWEDGKLTLEVEETRKVVFRIKNDGNIAVIFQKCFIPAIHNPKMCTLTDKYQVTSKTKPWEIPPGGSYTVSATCKGITASSEMIPVLFHFVRENEFHILRYINIDTETSITKQLRPTCPYEKLQFDGVTYSAIERGLPLNKLSIYQGLENKIPLGDYPIPETIEFVIESSVCYVPDASAEEKARAKDILKMLREITPENYTNHFANLLHIEEEQMHKDICRYDIKNAELTTVKGKDYLFQLQVPGLAEQRPSLIRGDKLIAVHQNNEGKGYEGIIHVVGKNYVWLGFGSSFRSRFINGMKFDIRFQVNRSSLRLAHRAIELADELSIWNYLFPKWDKISEDCQQLMARKVQTFNRDIEKNIEQLEAIRCILANTSGSAPFIIYGPPGTGKTVTLVEAIEQLVRKDAKCRIIASAPSNSAADLIAERLLKNGHVSKRKIFRLYGTSRNYDAVPARLQEISNFDPQKMEFYFPAKKELMQFSVIIVTLATAGRLVSANFPSNHFTHVFIDECGQAKEPDAVIAIAGILEAISEGKRGQLILVGDPKQLGPIIRSRAAIKFKLDESILERLMKSEPYVKDRNNDFDYNSYVIQKFIRNYRSHFEILHIPNELFYDNELQPCANQIYCKELCKWQKLPNKDFPIIFHGIVGKDEQEMKSPSFFNRSEISVLLDYVKNLLEAREVLVKPEEIGVITPYHGQVQKIRQGLKILSDRGKISGKDPNLVTVGSTEDFQGQERRVIIISCVRSNPDFLQHDSRYRLGFLRNSKRFNVAVTRAKCLLIMIGNPHVLRLDENWNKYLKFCFDNDAYVGCHYNTIDSGICIRENNFEDLSFLCNAVDMPWTKED